MAKNIYVGVGSKARKVKALYVGVGGKARKVKKVYVGVGGKARLVYQAYIPVTSITLKSWSAQHNGGTNSVGQITCYFNLSPSNATNPSINLVEITNPSIGDDDSDGYKTKCGPVSGDCVIFYGATKHGSYSATIKVWAGNTFCKLTFYYSSKAALVNRRYYIDVVAS